MSNPEFIAQKCDGCGKLLTEHGTTIAIGHVGDPIAYLTNHSEAHRHARAAGWYIAEVDLCPVCAEKREVPK